MSKIGDMFIRFGNKINKPKETETAVVKEKIAIEEAIEQPSEQFVKSEENLPVESKLVSEVKEAVVDPIREMIKEHPDLATFITAMAAGGMAGLIAKKTEQKTKKAEQIAKEAEEESIRLKDLQKFTKKVKKFTNKVERRSMYLSASDGFGIGSLFGFPFLGGIGAGLMCGRGGTQTDFIAGVAALCMEGALMTAAAFTTLSSGNRILSRDKKFLMTDYHRFVTIPPSGDRLIFCSIVKDSDGKKLDPTVVKLDHKATHLSIDNNSHSFLVNYEDGLTRARYSDDGQKEGEISLYKNGNVGIS